jgi:hypothetical protein
MEEWGSYFIILLAVFGMMKLIRLIIKEVNKSDWEYDNEGFTPDDYELKPITKEIIDKYEVIE